MLSLLHLVGDVVMLYRSNIICVIIYYLSVYFSRFMLCFPHPFQAMQLAYLELGQACEYSYEPNCRNLILDNGCKGFCVCVCGGLRLLLLDIYKMGREGIKFET